MSPDSRAVVFDLDDTLYPYRRFVRSGLVAVAAHLEAEHGVNRAWLVRWLLRASRGADRGRELQACLAVLQLSPGLLPGLLHILRGHAPSIRLPRVSSRMLARLRADGWRLGVVTNGSPSIQTRKVAALGLAGAVDAVVYAAEHGSGAGKPEPEAFVEIARRLDVAPGRVVFVGDNPRTDIAGATNAGMRAMRCTVWTDPSAVGVAGRVIDDLSLVLPQARMLLEEASNRHAA